MSDAPFTILTICTGNVCRSPAAEYLLRSALGPSVEVSSAGTGALVGHAVDPQMAVLLPMSTDGFAARALTAEIVGEADLVLAMTREHRGRALEAFPAAVRRAFTLREFARILSLPDAPAATADTTGEALRELLPWAAQTRSRARATDPAEDDIDDPFRQSDAVFGTVEAQIRHAVQAIDEAVRKS
ncbi:MAG: hypothetical protein Q4F67_00585 [Propionibacteriaceae bacterium]|nr:hypothetical protein [Propionibacteriaceae bacterium]